MPLLTQYSFATSISDPSATRSLTGCNINMDTLKQWHQKLRFSFTGGMETQYLQYRSTTVVPIMLVLAVISTSLITAQIVLRFRSPPPRPAWALVLDFVGLAPSFVIVWIAPLRCCPPAIAEGSGRRVWLFYLATWSAFAVGLGRDTALLMLGHESMLFDGGDGILLKMVLMHNLQVLSFWDALATSLACSVLPLCVFFPNAILIQRLLVTVLVSAATGWLGETSTRRDFVLQQTLKGKEAESQFLARMSHEIRTPLLGICGFLELLQATPLSSVQQDYVSSMGTATTLLRSIVNDTLDHAKLRAGKMQVLCTITLHRPSTPSLSTVTLHRHSAPSLCTITLDRHSPPSLSTVPLHRHSTPSLCTITLHRHSAPSLSTVNLHHHSAPSPSTVTRHRPFAPHSTPSPPHRQSAPLLCPVTVPLRTVTLHCYPALPFCTGIVHCDSTPSFNTASLRLYRHYTPSLYTLPLQVLSTLLILHCHSPLSFPSTPRIVALHTVTIRHRSIPSVSIAPRRCHSTPSLYTVGLPCGSTPSTPFRTITPQSHSTPSLYTIIVRCHSTPPVYTVALHCHSAPSLCTTLPPLHRRSTMSFRTVIQRHPSTRSLYTVALHRPPPLVALHRHSAGLPRGNAPR